MAIPGASYADAGEVTAAASTSATASSSSALTSTLTAMGALGAWGKWTAAIMQAAERENVDAAVLGGMLALIRPGGKTSAAEIRNAAKGLARAFYATGSVDAALKQIIGDVRAGVAPPGAPGIVGGIVAAGVPWSLPLPAG